MEENLAQTSDLPSQEMPDQTVPGCTTQDCPETISDDIAISPAERHKPKIEVMELDNPDFAASSIEFKDLLRELVDEIHLPTIDYESLHNYFCSMAKGIRQAKLTTPSVVPEAKILVGYADGILSGIMVLYMLPYRLPHIGTMDCPYCISRNARVSYAFVKELLRCKKAWRARYVNLVATNDRLVKIYMRAFKKMRIIGTVMVGEGMKEKLLKL